MDKDQKISLLKRKRTVSRLVAAQTLYQFKFFNEEKKVSELKFDLLNEYVLSEDENERPFFNNIEEEFVDQLTSGVLNNKEYIDSKILELKKTSQDIENLLNEILRLAIYELKFQNSTPKEVIINEYVNIASFFYDNSKVSFVNSLIDNVAKNE